MYNQISHRGHIATVSDQVLTRVWDPIIVLLSDYQICEILTHRHLWNSAIACEWWPLGFDFDIWWFVWPCDHHLLVIFITTSANEDIPVPNTSDIWKCLRLIKVDDIWVKFAKISDKNDFCTNFSITHCQIVCKRKCNANWWKNVSLQYYVPKMHTTSCVPSDIMLEISS